MICLIVLLLQSLLLAQRKSYSGNIIPIRFYLVRPRNTFTSSPKKQSITSLCCALATRVRLKVERTVNMNPAFVSPRIINEEQIASGQWYQRQYQREGERLPHQCRQVTVLFRALHLLIYI